MVRQEQQGGGSLFKTGQTGTLTGNALLNASGGPPGAPAAAQAARDAQKAKLDAAQARAARLAEERETAWALVHLPPKRERFWPWVPETMSLKESIQGIATPFSDTAAEKRLKTAQGLNGVRRQVRDAFWAGQSRDQIRMILQNANPDTRPRDIDLHYGVSDNAPVPVNLPSGLAGNVNVALQLAAAFAKLTGR